MATVVGLVHLTLNVSQAMSLKDKRRIIKSFKDRTTHSSNVSIAEVGGLESCRRAELAVAMVGSDQPYVDGALQRILQAASNHRDMILVDYDIEWL